MTRLLNEKMIRELLTVKEINEIVDQTFKYFGEDKVINPPKVNLDLGETGNYPYYEGFMNAMPAYIGGDSNVAGLKWVGGFAGERKKANLPYITAMILLVNPQVGNFEAVLEGSYISNMRTGSQTAVALKYLHPKKEITIGMYGAGLQARTQIETISEWFDITRLVVWNHRSVTAEAFAQEMKQYVKGEIIVADPAKPQEAANNDALITVTPAQEPFLTKEMIKPGTIVFPMGSFQEVSDDLILAADKIIVDHTEQALHRGALKSLNSQGIITEEHITTTIGELAVGKADVGDLSNVITLCIPIGTGAVDVAVAARAYEKAVEQGIGETFTFFDNSF